MQFREREVFGASLGDLSCSAWVWLKVGLPEGPPGIVALPRLGYEPLEGDSEIV